MELESKIEGLLFYKGEDVSINKIAELLKVSTSEVKEALAKLDQTLASRGVTIIYKDDSVMLGISRDLSPLIESIRKDEMTRELSKASLETLSIILYKSGVARSEIDYIRGVNSSFILRNLLVRGLIEKLPDEKDTRRFLYKPTFDTLSFMGVTSLDELPNYIDVRAQLGLVINQDENHD
ncbi:MAG: SMC-Scp complex subunit ScpB [Patescibacteria group bacterium]